MLLSKGSCFEDMGPVCGDFRVDEGEACDAGPDDPCCTPECTLVSGADCRYADRASQWLCTVCAHKHTLPNNSHTMCSFRNSDRFSGHMN